MSFSNVFRIYIYIHKHIFTAHPRHKDYLCLFTIFFRHLNGWVCTSISRQMISCMKKNLLVCLEIYGKNVLRATILLLSKYSDNHFDKHTMLYYIGLENHVVYTYCNGNNFPDSPLLFAGISANKLSLYIEILPKKSKTISYNSHK